jgi:prepilin-type N-terminal cleavage/methylation domain-containing protein
MLMRRRGLSLVEVLIAMVLLGIVGAGITRLLSSQLRFFAAGTNQRDARTVSRNALNLTRSELRMVEPNGIMAATRDSITFRLPYMMGLYCTASTAMFVNTDSLTRAQAQYGGYAYRDTTTNATYTYVVQTGALGVGNVATCVGAGLTGIPDGWVYTVTPAMGALAVGAPFFLWQTVTYKFAASTLVPGRTALWRKAGSAAAEEIAVPLDTASRFNFYTNTTTSSTTVPTLNTMRGIEVLLYGESERTSPGRTTPEESLQRVSIFFRNAVQ